MRYVLILFMLLLARTNIIDAQAYSYLDYTNLDNAYDNAYSKDKTVDNNTADSGTINTSGESSSLTPPNRQLSNQDSIISINNLKELHPNEPTKNPPSKRKDLFQKTKEKDEVIKNTQHNTNNSAPTELSGNVKLLVMDALYRNEASIKNGPYKQHYQNGNLRFDVTYKDNKLDGPYKEYYLNGQLKMKGFFKDGLANGLFTFYYENGKFRKEVTYKNGKASIFTLSTKAKKELPLAIFILFIYFYIKKKLK